MKEFNIIVSGIGGQGVLTIANILAEAAMKNGYDVKESELHGLAMRFGHLECHVRFGKDVYSSVVERSGANLIIALERLETLRSLYYTNKKSIIVFDTKVAVPVQLQLEKIRYPGIDEVNKIVKKFTKKFVCINSSKASKELTGKTIFSNIYLLGYAFSKGHIPLKKESLEYGIKQIVPSESYEINKKVFEAAIKESRK